MPIKRRSAAQARKDKASLKLLAKSGHKVDLRKAPTRRQLKEIEKLKAELARLREENRRLREEKKKAAKRKKRAKKVKRVVKAAKKTVKRAKKIAKRAKKSLAPRISRTRTIVREQIEKLKPSKTLKTYALPFMRKGHDKPEWRRFTLKQLRSFMAEYKPDDPEGAAEWMSYAVEEIWTFETVKSKRERRVEIERASWGERMSDAPKRRRKKKVVKKTNRTRK